MFRFFQITMSKPKGEAISIVTAHNNVDKMGRICVETPFRRLKRSGRWIVCAYECVLWWWWWLRMERLIYV